MAFRPFRSDEKCPTTTFDLHRREKELKCKYPGRYHCIRNEYGILGEVCHEPVWILKGFYPEFNTNVERVVAEQCNGTFGACPLDTYFSNKAISYSSCVKRRNIISEPLTSTRSRESTAMHIMNTPMDTKRVTIVVPIVATIVAIVVLLTFTALGFLAYKKMRPNMPKRRKEKGNRSEKDECQAPSATENIQFARGERDGLLPQNVEFENIETESDDVSREEREELQEKNGGVRNLATEMTHATREALRLLRSKGTFVVTKARKEIERVMLERKVAFISGFPGSGKTSACFDILCTYEDNGEGTSYNILVFNDIQDVDAENVSDNTVMVLDDCFEKWFYIQSKREKDKDNLRKILQHIKKRNKVYALFTMRPCTRNAFNDHLRDCTENKVIDFIEMENVNVRLTKEECKELLEEKQALYKQNIFYKIKEGDLEKLVTETLRWQSTVGQIEAFEIHLVYY